MRRAALLAAALLGGCAKAPPATIAAPADALPLGTLPRQALGPGECAMFLWKQVPTARLVLMVKAGPPPVARIMLDGQIRDLPRRAAGDANAPATYGDGNASITLDVVVEERRGLSGGAVITSGTLRFERAGGEGMVVPVSGLLACR